jgi:hypothetical protein
LQLKNIALSERTRLRKGIAEFGATLKENYTARAWRGSAP